MIYKDCQVRQTKDRNIILIDENGNTFIIDNRKENLSDNELKDLVDKFIGDAHGN